MLESKHFGISGFERVRGGQDFGGSNPQNAKGELSCERQRLSRRHLGASEFGNSAFTSTRNRIPSQYNFQNHDTSDLVHWRIGNWEIEVYSDIRLGIVSLGLPITEIVKPHRLAYREEAIAGKNLTSTESVIEVTRGKDKSCGTRSRHATFSRFRDLEGRGDIELLYIELPVHEIALIFGSREKSRTIDF
jgi:hypothetical protein